MAEYKMLGEFVHYCSKCKLNLNHRITLMDGDAPARVLCLTCNSERRFKSPKAPSTRRSVAAKVTTSKEKAKVQGANSSLEWRQTIRDKEHLARPYNINEAFQMNTVVIHPTFGKGLIVGFDHPNKLRIFFDGDVKVLRGQLASSK